MKILVVDDEALVAQTLSIIFKKNGFDVATAYSATEALDLALARKPDLVLCDIDMPGRDGIGLMQDLGRELPDCPILVLTGVYAALGRIRDCADGLHQKVKVITKPCQPVELLRQASIMLQSA